MPQSFISISMCIMTHFSMQIIFAQKNVFSIITNILVELLFMY